MSAWRKEASKRLPELKRIVASREVDTPMMLWIELRLKFSELCELGSPPWDLLGRIWKYAAWCMEHGSSEVATAAVLGFCEHLLDTDATRRTLPRIMSRREYEGLRETLLHHDSDERYLEVLKEFSSQEPV